MNKEFVHYEVLFKHFTVRKSPIFTNYRPDWTSERKPEYNGGALSFTDKDKIIPGEECKCILMPMCPDLWQVEIGDIIFCMEGSRKVGEAVVLKIIDNKI